jgi:hypothetical protein
MTREAFPVHPSVYAEYVRDQEQLRLSQATQDRRRRLAAGERERRLARKRQRQARKDARR